MTDSNLIIFLLFDTHFYFMIQLINLFLINYEFDATAVVLNLKLNLLINLLASIK